MVDLIYKLGLARSVPIPNWDKAALDQWRLVYEGRVSEEDLRAA